MEKSIDEKDACFLAGILVGAISIVCIILTLKSFEKWEQNIAAIHTADIAVGVP